MVELTTKLTTHWLDVPGRRWTMRRHKTRIQGQIRRLWTTLDKPGQRCVLHNRRVQARFLSHLHRQPECMGLLPCASSGMNVP
jgi:hypothetical protein